MAVKAMGGLGPTALGEVKLGTFVVVVEQIPFFVNRQEQRRSMKFLESCLKPSARGSVRRLRLPGVRALPAPCLLWNAVRGTFPRGPERPGERRRLFCHFSVCRPSWERGLSQGFSADISLVKFQGSGQPDTRRLPFLTGGGPSLASQPPWRTWGGGGCSRSLSSAAVTGLSPATRRLEPDIHYEGGLIA